MNSLGTQFRCGATSAARLCVYKTRFRMYLRLEIGIWKSHLHVSTCPLPERLIYEGHGYITVTAVLFSDDSEIININS